MTRMTDHGQQIHNISREKDARGMYCTVIKLHDECPRGFIIIWHLPVNKFLPINPRLQERELTTSVC